MTAVPIVCPRCGKECGGAYLEDLVPDLFDAESGVSLSLVASERLREALEEIAAICAADQELGDDGYGHMQRILDIRTIAERALAGKGPFDDENS